MPADIRTRMIQGKVAAGDSFTAVRTFAREDTQHFEEISRDRNPVHSNLPYARGKGFNGLICHGLLVGSLVSEIGGQLAMLASGMNFRFKRPVYFGDTITCTLVIDEMDQTGRVKCSATFSNQCGETVIEGQLFGVLPNEKERELLQKSQDE
ncbi:MAG: MaoC family dehydratase [Proteobacteria bacterium]|nr:MaoC family dehydratase [Pseudomonadota bacterium]